VRLAGPDVPLRSVTIPLIGSLNRSELLHICAHEPRRAPAGAAIGSAAMFAPHSGLECRVVCVFDRFQWHVGERTLTVLLTVLRCALVSIYDEDRDLFPLRQKGPALIFKKRDQSRRKKWRHGWRIRRQQLSMARQHPSGCPLRLNLKLRVSGLLKL
jgi:hypothetical protein